MSRYESVRGRAHLAQLGFAMLRFAYHLVICCTDNIVDGVVSPALIASDSIWAVAGKALLVDSSVRFGSVRFRRVRFSSFSENERAVENGYKGSRYDTRAYCCSAYVSTRSEFDLN